MRARPRDAGVRAVGQVMRAKELVMWRVSVLLSGLILGGCTNDGDLLYLRAAAAQPDDPVHGRLVSVFASSSDRGEEEDAFLHLRLSAGTLRSIGETELRSELCARVRRKTLHEEKIAVLPDNSESLLVASLRNADSEGGCAGTVRTQIIVPVQRVGQPPGALLTDYSLDEEVVP